MGAPPHLLHAVRRGVHLHFPRTCTRTSTRTSLSPTLHRDFPTKTVSQSLDTRDLMLITPSSLDTRDQTHVA